MKGIFILLSKVKWDRRFLNIAIECSSWSKDPSTKVGAVIVEPESRRIISTGYNGFPRNIRDMTSRLTNREEKYRYTIHAEMNAIYNATFNGISPKGSTLYVYGLPTCSNCAKGIAQVGIKRVVCLYPQKVGETWNKWADEWDMSKALYDEAGLTYTVYSETDTDYLKVLKNTSDLS